MKLLDLFITSSIPVGKILVITGIGFYLALDRVNILNQDARKQLNNIVFYVFSPSLVASSLAETITYESLVKMWFMPLNVVLTFIIGSFLGWLVIKITKPPSHLRGIIVGCCAAGNLGNMPLIIIPAICNEKGSPFGDPETCEKYGLGYVALSMAIGSICIWTYVYNLMRVLARETPIIIGTSSTVPLIPTKVVQVEEQFGTWSKIKQRVCSATENINLGTIFAPSTIAALIALGIGLIPTLRKLLIGNTAPLRVIEDSVSLLGEGTIPLLTLIIGGNLLKGKQQQKLQVNILLTRKRQNPSLWFNDHRSEGIRNAQVSHIRRGGCALRVAANNRCFDSARSSLLGLDYIRTALPVCSSASVCCSTGYESWFVRSSRVRKILQEHTSHGLSHRLHLFSQVQ
ncbi:protein PIN-LIKES 1 isoform X3 [Brassica rapa]|uniref:protein PIN-LIKES 1 isoform X3 n=1 Tax=Brassica campestris TaxID=3711 RepID=UPI00142E2558|nr:protein PIN-LIKES 1 isoform X3 [Brassica rapa]